MPNSDIMDYNNGHMIECERSISTYIRHSCLIISYTQPMSNPRQHWYYFCEKQCNSQNDRWIAFAIHFKCCHWCTSSLIDSICMISTYLNVFNSHHYLFSITQATIINESIAFLIQKLFELFYGKSISFRTLIFVLGMPMIKIYPCT